MVSTLVYLAWFHSHRLHPSPSQLSPRQPEKHMIKSSSSIVTTIQEEGLETLLPLRTLSVKPVCQTEIKRQIRKYCKM